LVRSGYALISEKYWERSALLPFRDELMRWLLGVADALGLEKPTRTHESLDDISGSP